MALILKIGDYNQMAPVPRSFPTCYDYKTTMLIDEKLRKSSSTATNLVKDKVSMISAILLLLNVRYFL